MNKENLTENYQGLIRKIARNYNRAWGHEFEDTLSDAHFCFSKALRDYAQFDPEKCSENTWFYNKVHNFMRNIHRNPRTKGQKAERKAIKTSMSWGIEPMAKPRWFDNLLSEVSTEASFLLRTIMDAPSEIIDELVPKRGVGARKAIQRHFIDDLKWDKHKLNSAWDEVQECLSAKG